MQKLSRSLLFPSFSALSRIFFLHHSIFLLIMPYTLYHVFCSQTKLRNYVKKWMERLYICVVIGFGEWIVWLFVLKVFVLKFWRFFGMDWKVERKLVFWRIEIERLRRDESIEPVCISYKYSWHGAFGSLSMFKHLKFFTVGASWKRTESTRYKELHALYFQMLLMQLKPTISA